jgi:hypothetical protein
VAKSAGLLELFLSDGSRRGDLLVLNVISILRQQEHRKQNQQSSAHQEQ